MKFAHNMGHRFVGSLDQSEGPFRKTRQRNELMNSRTLTNWPSSAYIKRFYHEVLNIMQYTGSSVLHSDVDAFWTRNPDALLHQVISEHPDVDIIASQHFEPVPADVNSIWGFILNMGFVMFRNTAPTKALIQQDILATDGNDQELLNHVLFAKGCSWTEGDLKVGQCGDLKVVALPYHQVSRETVPLKFTHDLAVWHPDTGRLRMMDAETRLTEYVHLKLC